MLEIYKKLFTLVFAILLVSCVSAMTFDNVLKVDKTDSNIITIKDNFGLGGELVKVQKVSNTDFCGIECNTIWNISIYDAEDDFLTDLIFKEVNGREKEINYKFEIAESYQEVQVPVYEKVCSKVSMGNTTESCNQQVKEYKTQFIPIWKPLELTGKLPEGDYLIKLTGYKRSLESIDWIPSFYGERVDEWAWWVGTEPVGYWKFNEGTGNAIDSSSYGHDLTNYNPSDVVYRAGVLGNASYNFTGVRLGFSNSDVYNVSNNDFTIAFWANWTGVDSTTAFVSSDISFGNDGTWFAGIYSVNSGTNLSFITFNIDSTQTDLISNYSINDSSYHRFVITRDGDSPTNSILVYMDNNLTARADVPIDYYFSKSKNISVGGLGSNGNWNLTGSMDDLQLYNITWTQADVTNDWNNGGGKEGDAGGLTASLIVPLDNAEQTSSSVLFNCTFVITGGNNITNGSLVIDNVIEETETYAAGTRSEEIYTTKSVGRSSHNWTCFAYDTEHTITWAGVNRSFEIVDFAEQGTYYTTTAYETDRENYQINVSTIDSIQSVNAKLYYNGTFYDSIVSCNTTSWCEISNALDISYVAGATEQKVFYWQVVAYNGTSSTTTNTTHLHQNVSQIHLEECSATYPVLALNYTAYTEGNLTRLPTFSFEGFFEYWLGTGTTKKNSTLSNSSIEEAKLCIHPNETFYYDSSISYDESGNTSSYVSRYYNEYNQTATNVTTNISLYLLESESSTTFIQEVTRSNEPVENAYIYTYRYYPGEGEWKLSQISVTNAEGKTVGFYQVETALYKHSIYVNGILELEETEGTKMIPEATPYTISWDLGTIIPDPLEPLENQTDLTKNLTFNDITNMVTFKYVSNGSTTQGRLEVYQENYSVSNTLICNETSPLSTATLNCNLTGYEGNFIARGYITKLTNGELIESLVDAIRFSIGTGKDIFGMTGVIIGFFILLTVAMIFIWNPIMDIIALNVTFLVLNLIGLIHFGLGFVFGIMCVSGIIIWIMRE